MFFLVQRCIDTESTTAPRKVCFCAMGYFGKNCQNQSPLTGKVNLENNGYVKRNFKDIFDIYWKIIGNEIEVVMQAATENFVAVGFRPENAQKSCQAFPKLENRPDTSSVGGEAESESEPESEAESESEPEGEAESESEPDGKAKYEGEAESHSEPEGEAESESEPEGEAYNHNEPEGEAESENKPEGQASNIKKSKDVNQYQPKGSPTKDFHAMDCQDIVLGMARGMYSRIYDSYTRDR